MLRPPVLRSLTRGTSRIGAFAPCRSLATKGAFSKLSSNLDVNQIHNRRREYESNRTAFLTAGAAAGILASIYTAWKLKQSIDLDKEKAKLAAKCDTEIPTETFKTEAGEKRKLVVHDDQGNEIVPTGNSVVKAFPRLLTLDGSGNDNVTSIAAAGQDEYTLVGLGMRTVTFLGIQVYLVGWYVATQDIAKLQHYLVKKINPLATTLIPSEKDELRQRLLDPKEGEQLWDELLQESGCRSVFRISPVRDTDFHHLRDGFVRAIAARSNLQKQAYNDEDFGEAMKDFKGLFSRGKVPKQREMLLCRDARGQLKVTYTSDTAVAGEPQSRQALGQVADERLSRLLWLNYLAGKNVASEPARQNIIEGVMEFVERPVGTVATQVV
ncbi:hypothetical protein VHEMI08532 [[Torrubiella] hemipterigena]|uniref:Chalcone isomerase domain-containing protein n=1 Tax=[Torrubiella] hemipterigena TaxID=1531966 RepID=A0A0A1TNC0_9HYPO|nr:hypothetical protein VHEMI08532 [[Torrubiella] hemipterigena]